MKATAAATARREQLSIATTSALLIGAGIFGSIVSARVLGPHERGVLVAWQVWAVAIGILAACGLPQVAVTMPNVRWAQIWATQVLTATLGALIAVVAVFVLGAGVTAMIGAAAMALATSLNGSQVAWHQRTGHLSWHFNAQRFAPPAALTLTITVLALTSVGDAEVWFIAMGLSQLAATICIGLAFGLGPRLSRNALSRAVIDQALRTAPINWLAYFQYRSDMLLASAFLPSAQVAYYSIASALEGAIFALGQTFGMRWFSQHKSAPARRAAVATVVTTGVAAAVMAIASGPLILLAYGRDFEGAVPAAMLLCFAAIPRSLDYLVTHVAMARGNAMALTGVKAAGIGVLTLLAFTLVASHGSAQLLAALTLATALLLVIAQVLAMRFARLREAVS